MENEKVKKIVKAVVIFLTALATGLATLFGLQSCQVARTVTTSAESYQRGDTAMVIQTKTIETYTGTKK